MKILQVISALAPQYGGPSFACPELSKELAELGHQVSLYTTDMDGEGHLKVPTDHPVVSDGVEFHYFRGRNLPGKYIVSRDMWNALRDTVAQFDIAHIWSVYGYSNTVASYWCRRRNVPYVAFPHGSLDPFLRNKNRPRKWIYTKLFSERDYRESSAVMFTTQEEERLAADWSGLATKESPDSPLRIIAYTGIGSEWLQQPDRVAGRRLREKFPKLNGRRLVVYLGRINFKKGLDILARAFSKVARNRDDLHLVIAGPDTGGYEATVRNLLAEGGALDKTTFTGMLTGQERVAVVQEAEVFALPSYTENFGQVVFEAMASGVPVVISDRVNVWHEVLNAGAGKVVPCDADATAKAIGEILDDPATGRQMGASGRQWVVENLPWSIVTARIADAYAEVIRHHHGISRDLPHDRLVQTTKTSK
jgi:glycosyltransferase involved in cell wall biosynthesis